MATSSASPRREPRILVEFAGPPGAGKTTLSRQLCALLSADGWSVDQGITEINSLRTTRRIIRKLGVTVPFVVANLPTTLSAAWCVVKTRPRLHRSSLLAYLNWLLIAALIETHCRSNANLITYDQGLFQATWSLCWRAANPSAATSLAPLAAKLLAATGRPILVVVLSTSDPAVGLKRGLTRSRLGPPGTRSPSYDRTGLAAHDAVALTPVTLEITRSVIQLARSLLTPKLRVVELVSDASTVGQHAATLHRCTVEHARSC